MNSNYFGGGREGFIERRLCVQGIEGRMNGCQVEEWGRPF